MAKMAADDGIRTIVATPHQLGAFSHNQADALRKLVDQLQRELDDRGAPLQVLPGADVRIEADIVERLRRGDVLTLADRGRHVLLELPHELYFPLDRLLDQLRALGLTAILSHPERNEGLLSRPERVAPLVRQGCLMQITSDSLMGQFGRRCRRMAQWLLQENLTHFVATDAHSTQSRRPRMRRAFQQVAQLVGPERAIQLCCGNPAAVAAGEDLPAVPAPPRRQAIHRWFGRRRAG